MADLLKVVPGSRRPIRVDSTGVVVNIAIQGPDYSSVSSKIGTNSSASRRKPQTTYRSPSLQFSNDLCIERSGQLVRRSPSGHGPSVPTTRTASNASPAHGGAAGVTTNPNIGPAATLKPKYPMKPPLPIYHPLGRLALSLPQLDFSAHPQGSLGQTDDASRSASRSRRPAARVRDAAETDSVDASTPLAVPADAQIPPEKPSPRKRRAGGQSSSRRRRRDADDGDATYPAKRTRANRAPPAVPPSDGGSPGNGGPDTAEVDGSEEGMKAPERRSTRSRAAAQAKPLPARRNSSASDRTQTSVSVSIAGSQAARREDADFAIPNATVRSSVTSSGQAEAVPVANATLEEPPTQSAQTWVSGQAKVTETQPVSKMDVDEAPRGKEDAGLGVSGAVGTSLKPEEDERNDEAGPSS